MATNIIDFAKIPKKGSPQQALRQWLKRQPSPRGVVAPKGARVKAVPLNAIALKELHDVVTSDERRAEEAEAAARKSRALLKGKTTPRSVTRGPQRGAKALTPSRLFGTLYSAFNTLAYIRMKDEYRRRKALAGGSPLAQAGVDARWRQIVASAQTAFKVGGLAVSEATLDGYAQQLKANGAYFASVTNLWHAAVPAGPGGVLSSSAPVLAAFVPTVVAATDLVPVTSLVPDICATPLKQGSFTKHIANSVTLRVRITYWCPTWSDWSRTCTTTVTLASVGFSVDINVGYKITCCGATAWGQASTQACASALFISACAGCTGTIVGVAGVSRTPVAGGSCSYGLGITASLKCVLAGITLLNVSYTFGWVVTGPCPPANVCA